MFCLLVVLVKLSLLVKWLARKTPLRKPNRGEGIISIKPRPKRAYNCVGLLYSFVVLLHDIWVIPDPVWYISYFYGIGYLCLVRHPCRKLSGSILTISEPAQGRTSTKTQIWHNSKVIYSPTRPRVFPNVMQHVTLVSLFCTHANTQTKHQRQ